MHIATLSVTGLFDEFDYTLSLSNSDGIAILAGPNGYGKTTILNIIFNLSKFRPTFFHKLPFKTIVINFSDNSKLSVIKSQGKNKDTESHCLFELFDENLRELAAYAFPSNREYQFSEHFINFMPVDRISDDLFYDTNSDDEINFEEAIERYWEILPNGLKLNKFNKKYDKIKSALEGKLPVHFIREQRLIRKITRKIAPIEANKDSRRLMEEAINAYAEDIMSQIRRSRQIAFYVTQKLDESFPSRLR